MNYDEKILNILEEKSKKISDILIQMNIDVNAYSIDIMF